MFNVCFFFTGVKIPFTEKEKGFCMLEYAQTQSNKTL